MPIVELHPDVVPLVDLASLPDPSARARRLPRPTRRDDDGVPTELHVYQGAVHGVQLVADHEHARRHGADHGDRLRPRSAPLGGRR